MTVRNYFVVKSFIRNHNCIFISQTGRPTISKNYNSDTCSIYTCTFKYIHGKSMQGCGLRTQGYSCGVLQGARAPNISA